MWRLAEIVERALVPVRQLHAFGVRRLHPMRRAMALRAVAAASPVRSVLFVCHGNVCRSPFAAAVLSRRLGEAASAIEVKSTGFVGIRRPPPSSALAAAARRGYDISAHRASFIKQPMVDEASLVIVMQPSQKNNVARRFQIARSRIVVLGDLDPEATGRRTIRDPMGRENAMFDEAFDRIERCVNELARLILPALRLRRIPVPTSRAEGR